MYKYLEDIIREVRISLKNELPYLLLRAGDGEAIVLEGYSELFKYVFKRQFGVIATREDEKVIIPLIKSYSEADIIGVPLDSLHNEGHWTKVIPLLEDSIGKEFQRTNIDIHFELLESGFLEELLNEQEHLIYISGRDLSGKLFEKYKLKSIYSYTVPAEQKFEENKISVEKNHYNYHFDKVMEWISKVDVEGKLCLVGAGILGKIYAAELKRRGGVVLEIGSVFDKWYGKVTRGKDRGARSYSNTYKL